MQGDESWLSPEFCMDELIKNLWVMLTIVIPGMTTYGTLRLLMLLFDCRIDKSAFEKIDASTLLTTSLIVAIALVQQAVALVFEAGASFVCSHCSKVDRSYFSFFCDRFRLAASGKLNESATRIFGNFFTSVNITVGQFFILVYFRYRGLDFRTAVMRVVLVLVVVSVIASVFRLHNVKSIVAFCEDGGGKPKPAIEARVPFRSRSASLNIVSEQTTPPRRSSPMEK